MNRTPFDTPMKVFFLAPTDHYTYWMVVVETRMLDIQFKPDNDMVSIRLDDERIIKVPASNRLMGDLQQGDFFEEGADLLNLVPYQTDRNTFYDGVHGMA